MKFTGVSFWVAISVLFCACAGAVSETAGTTPPDADDTYVAPVQEGSASEVEISGLLGTIPQHKIENEIKSRWRHFEECYGEALEVLEEIEGSFEMAMEVDSNGDVTVAFLRSGNLGSSEAEQCFVSQMKRFSFPKPAGGGKAVISFPITLPAPYDHPKPFDWSGAKAHKVLSDNSADVERCLKGNGGVQLTLYVSTGGRVVSAGGTSDTYDMYEAALCIADAAKSWKFPDPGPSRPAKVEIKF